MVLSQHEMNLQHRFMILQIIYYYTKTTSKITTVATIVLMEVFEVIFYKECNKGPTPISMVLSPPLFINTNLHYSQSSITRMHKI